MFPHLLTLSLSLTPTPTSPHQDALLGHCSSSRTVSDNTCTSSAVSLSQIVRCVLSLQARHCLSHFLCTSSPAPGYLAFLSPSEITHPHTSPHAPPLLVLRQTLRVVPRCFDTRTTCKQAVYRHPSPTLDWVAEEAQAGGWRVSVSCIQSIYAPIGKGRLGSDGMGDVDVRWLAWELDHEGGGKRVTRSVVPQRQREP